jgi:hypothetical protein
MQKLQRQVVQLRLGPFTVVAVEAGWSPTVVGEMKGRIDIPGAATGYLFLRVEVFTKRMVLACWQLA